MIWLTEEKAYRPVAQTVCCWPRSGCLPEEHQRSGAQLALAVVEGSLAAYNECVNGTQESKGECLEQACYNFLNLATNTPFIQESVVLPFVSWLILSGGPSAAVLRYNADVGIVAFVLSFQAGQVSWRGHASTNGNFAQTLEPMSGGNWKKKNYISLAFIITC